MFKITAMSANEATIYLYGNVGSWEEINVRDFTQALQEAERSYNELHVRINSGGGEVFEGFAIYNLLKQSKAKIHTYNDGIAASMASVLLMAGSTVHMSKNALLMIHLPSGGQWGNADDLREYADMMDKLADKLFGVYAEKTGKEMEEIKTLWMDGKDHWITAEEALAFGLIDDIYDSAITSANTTDSVFKMTAHYQNQLINLITKPNTMKKLIANINKLGISGVTLADTATEDEVNAALQQLTSAHADELAAKRKELEAVQADLDKVKNEVAAAKVTHLKDKAAALIDMAKATNKIVAKEAEHLLKLAEASEDGYATVKALIDEKKPYKAISSQLSGGEGKATDDLAAEWDALFKSGKLEALKASDAERYAELFEAKYGKKPAV